MDEERPYSTRMSTLNTLCGFLQATNEENVANEIFEVFWYLYFYLSDDDSDIREKCTIFCCKYFHCSISTSIHCETMLMRHMSNMAGYVHKSIEYITGFKTFQQQFEEALTPDSLLFSIEKQNLFRSDLSKLGHFESSLVKLGSSVQQEDKSCLTQWAEKAIRYLQTQQRELKLAEDGLLGWTSSSPDIFLILTRLQTAIRILTGWKQTNINIKPLQDLERHFKFHELLIV
jgi:hypothetical protein